MTTRQPRKRLYSHVTRSRFLHLEDALDIGKVRLFAGEYKRGRGSSATVHHFLDLADARVLLADLSWAKKVEFTDYKGTGGDDPQSRVLKIKTNGDKVWFEIQNGPGQIIGQGAVKPAGKPDAAVSIPLTMWEARKLAHAALAYIRAWEVRRLLDVTPSGPVGGGGDAAPQDRPASKVATETGHQVAAPVATAPELFESPGAAIAWGFKAGAFKAQQHARNAYQKLKTDKQPKTAREMARLWVGDVHQRLGAAAG